MGIRHERCRMSTTVALRGHSNRVAGCPLSGVKRTPRAMHTKRGGCAAVVPAKKRFLSGNVRALHRIFGEARRSHSRTSAFGVKADITLRLCSIGFLFRLRHSGRFAPADCFPGAILVSIPNTSNDNVVDHAHDRGNDQRHQELAHGSGLLTTEQRKRVLHVSLRGCPRRRSPIGRMSAIGPKRTKLSFGLRRFVR